MIGVKKEHSRFTVWDENFVGRIFEKCTMRINIADRIGYTNYPDIFHLILSWDLILQSNATRDFIIKSIFETAFWIEFKKEVVKISDLSEICEDSYSDLTQAYNAKIKTYPKVNAPKMIEFSKTNGEKFASDLFEKLKKGYNQN